MDPNPPERSVYRGAWRAIGGVVDIAVVGLVAWGALSAYEAMSVKALAGLGVLLLALLVFRGRR